MNKNITIGISGPVNLALLNWDLDKKDLPETNAFPLTSHLINALLKRGYTVVAYTNSNDIAEPLVLQDKNLTVCIGRTKGQAGRRLFDFERQELLAHMKAYPSDIIYAFWSYEYSWAGLDSGIPTIVSIHDVASRILFTQFDAFRLARWYMNYKVLSKAKYVVANSDYTYEQLSRGVKRKAQIAYNFYDTSFEESIPRGLEKQNYIASISMGFTKRKGVPASLAAFAILRKKFPDLQYRLIGVGMEPGGEAQQYAEKHNLTEGVQFLGPLPFDELLRHVAQAKVLVHASVEESFGMAVLEAMVAGTPVVGGKKSGFVPHLLHHGEAGLLCDVNHPSSIAAATEKLLADDTLATRIKNKASAFAKANFSEEVVVDKLISYMQQVLAQESSVVQPTTADKATKPIGVKLSKDTIVSVHEV
ncbi:glycosyltransferase family 4 protein [uncultured Pontibacter sp.]|uniref:glycosyltransferase family 4 protein n=1 Tax=uncultured Pontibacter sp. TaxID=453356 RepID=UPI00260FD04D|nr:glycosyltransferase family 4 protein [uncultured Pontibacter sp.]